MKKTLIAQVVTGICKRMQYHITDYDKATAQPFYLKQQEQTNA